MKKKLVFIAGPYTHPDPVLNTRRAVEVAEVVEEMGGTPFIPHLTLAWNLVSFASVDRWYERDLEVLDHCEILVRFSGMSDGADNEVEYARKRGIPVFLWESDQAELRVVLRSSTEPPPVSLVSDPMMMDALVAGTD